MSKWGQYHEVPYKSNVKERIVAGLSWEQLLWVAPGVILSFQIATNVPKLPFDSILFSRVHWFVPLIISLVFATFKDPRTNLSLFQLMLVKQKLKRRKRTFLYRRSKMPKWEDVENR